MAKYRPVKTSFWEDSWIATLTVTEKLLYLYLITNPHTTLCGIYRVSIRYIAFESGLTIEQVGTALARFEKDCKVIYKDEWVVLVNNQKHQTASPKIKEGIKREIGELPPEIANLRYGIDRVSIGTDKPLLLLKPILEPKLVKEKIYKKENSENPIWIGLCNLIDSAGLENQVKPDLYLDTIAEYSKKGAASVEVRECLYWCRDKGKRIVTIMRIRNWLKNWAKYQKNQELKQLTVNQDQKMQENKFIQPKNSPIWTPPV